MESMCQSVNAGTDGNRRESLTRDENGRDPAGYRPDRSSTNEAARGGNEVLATEGGCTAMCAEIARNHAVPPLVEGTWKVRRRAAVEGADPPRSFRCVPFLLHDNTGLMSSSRVVGRVACVAHTSIIPLAYRRNRPPPYD